MKRVLFFFIGVTFSVSSWAQNYPVYSQYFSNPFLYNAGAIGLNDYTELNLNYRQQWVGVEDAPVTSSFSLQIPTKGNVSYAISGYSEKAVFLRNSVALATFGYRVPFSEEHFISFGLSAGAGVSNIDVDALDLSDPALLNAYSSSYYLDGQFGAYYTFKKLSIGVSLPKLFGTKTVSTEQFQEFKFSAFEDMIYTLSYEFNIPNSMLSITPYALYRSGNTTQEQVEATAIIDYRKIVYLGGSYRLDYGPSFFFGLSFKEMVDFGYAYEMASEQTAQLGQGTHEFQVKIRLGKKKRAFESPQKETKSDEIEQEPTPVVEEQPAEEAPKVEPEIVNVVPEVVEISKDTITNQPEIEPVKEEVNQPDIPVVIEAEKEEPEIIPEVDDTAKAGELGPGIYVVVGAFKVESNAVNYSQNIKASGFDNHVGRYKDGLYYVYVDKAKNSQEAQTIRDRISKNSQFDFAKAWVLEIDE